MRRYGIIVFVIVVATIGKVVELLHHDQLHHIQIEQHCSSTHCEVEPSEGRLTLVLLVEATKRFQCRRCLAHAVQVAIEPHGLVVRHSTSCPVAVSATQAGEEQPQHDRQQTESRQPAPSERHDGATEND